MDLYKNRRIVIQIIIGIILIIFIARLFYIQMIDKTFKDLASQNVIRRVPNYPNRGLIIDRAGKLVVFNDAVYDLYVIPSKVKEMDTIKFCSLLKIQPEFFREQLKKARKHSKHRPSIFVKQISAKDFALFQEYLYLFPGFYEELRTIRRYPFHSAGHILGYIGEVSPAQIEKNKSYQSGDYIGINGLEFTYEEFLKGRRGVRYMLVDNLNREKGRFKNGELDTPAIAGKNLILTVDIDLQNYGELLMQNKKGSIVCIEPSTGEILAMISSPVYDPNLLTGRERGRNFLALKNDTLQPLYNRPIMGFYPPGSTFKTLNGLIGLQEKVITTNTGFSCNLGYSLGPIFVKCRPHPSASTLSIALQYSCNAYFCNTFKRIIDNNHYKDEDASLAKWDEYLYSFGLGKKTGIDIPNEQPALVPSPEYYRKIYKGWRWKSSTIISLSIGQGEIATTPLQLANVAAAIANRGWWFIPHLAKRIDDPEFFKGNQFLIKRKTMVDSAYFESVVEAMYLTVEQGTARGSKIEGISMCGKTGTVQNPQGEDHSMFIAFAPKDNPKIAVCAIVENAGGGSKFAAPVASLMIEKYMNDTISTKRKEIEKRILETDLIKPKPKPVEPQ
jgi:penicillin-binding protein 2